MRRSQSSSSGRTMPRNTLLGLWRHWAGRLDDRARVEIVDSRGSVLVLKKEALLQELDKRKRKENAAATSQAQEVKGRTLCHQSNRLLRHEREHEARVRSREQRLVAGLLACQVSPTSGGADMQASATPYTLQRWQALGTSCAMVRKEMGDKSGDQTKPQDQQWVAVFINRKLVSCEKANKEKNLQKWKSLKMFVMKRVVYFSLFQLGYMGKYFEL